MTEYAVDFTYRTDILTPDDLNALALIPSLDGIVPGDGYITIAFRIGAQHRHECPELFVWRYLLECGMNYRRIDNITCSVI